MRDGGAGLGRQGTAAQHAGVARLQTDARSIGGDVGARLVNNRHHAERNGHARKLDAAIKRARIEYATERIGKRHQVLERVGHGHDTPFVEHQAIEQAFLGAGLTRCVHILGIGGHDGAGLIAQGTSHSGQGGVTLLRGSLRERRASILGGLRDRQHFLFQHDRLTFCRISKT